MVDASEDWGLYLPVTDAETAGCRLAWRTRTAPGPARRPAEAVSDLSTLGANVIIQAGGGEPTRTWFLGRDDNTLESLSEGAEFFINAGGGSADDGGDTGGDGEEVADDGDDTAGDDTAGDDTATTPATPTPTGDETTG